MNAYALTLLISIMAYTFLLSRVLGQWHRSRDHIYFIGALVSIWCWTGSEFFAYYYPLEESTRLLIMRYSVICWAPCSLFFFLFAYSLIQKPPGKIAILYIATSLVCSGIYAFTDQAVQAIRVYSWGMGYIPGPMHAWLLFIIAGIPALHAQARLAIAAWQTPNKPHRSTYLLLSGGGLITIVLSLGANAIIPELLGVKEFPQFGTAATALFFVFLYIALQRHQLLTISPARVAETVFEDVHDGIILTDTTGKIERVNPAASEMLSTTDEEVRGKTVDQLLLDRTTHPESSPNELCLDTDQERRYFSLTRSETSRGGVIIGHIILLSEITKHKRIEEMLVNSRDALEQEVQKRLGELEDAKEEIVQQAHQTELAAITTGTLHNVMNLLNSIKIAAESLEEEISNKRLLGLTKANQLLRDHLDDLETFILNDPKGKKLLSYYLTYGEILDQTIDNAKQRIDKVREMVSAIEVIVAAQQKYGGTMMVEEVSLTQLIEDAITMQSSSISSYGLEVIKEFSNTPRIRLQKTKLIHVLVNLIKNAKEAMMDTPVGERKLIFRTGLTGNTAFINLSDTGCGISPENLSKMFSYGFTTKPGGHGFGLHTCRIYLEEMGGSLNVRSDGEMAGATFVVELPVQQDPTPPEVQS